MTPDEIIDLLSVAAGYDRRTVGHADVEAWRQALDDPRVPNIGLTEAVDAIVLHYRDTTDFLMPTHVLARVKALRAETIAQLMPPVRVVADSTTYERVGELWRKATKDARDMRARRKAAVYAHPDLMQRLTEPPLNYPHASQWNGAIPPETFNGGQNDSPRRAALVEICDEAAHREAEVARRALNHQESQ